MVGELEPYAHLAEGFGARHIRRPIRDVDIPTVAEMRETLAEIRAALDAGETVYVHCWGGVGRTGTVVACLLVHDGYSAADALEAALWAFHTTATFEDGVLAAVNLGDDADTTGAIYGQLAGAHYGVDAIPASWRERLVLREEIVLYADALHDLAHA